MKAHDDTLRANVSRPEVVHTGDLPWTASPSPGVFRRRIELYGPPEQGRVTSVVRYAPGSRFPRHEHPEGEEILVLEGVFSDEEGDHPAGTYLRAVEHPRTRPKKRGVVVACMSAVDTARADIYELEFLWKLLGLTMNTHGLVPYYVGHARSSRARVSTSASSTRVSC